MPKLKDKSLPIHYKTSKGESEVNEQSRIVTGYFSDFDTVDSDQDIIRQGSFSKSISERGPQSNSNRQIKFLHQHSIVDPIGPIVKLFEDSKGLGFEAELEKTALGDTVLERYKNGTYKEHSFGFQYIWDKCAWIDIETRDDQGNSHNVEVFECKELNLFEGSVVTFGANENTPFTGFKGTAEDFSKFLEDELSFLLKNAPNYEYELKLRQLYHNQITNLKNLTAKSIKTQTKPKKEDGKLALMKSYVKT